MVNILEKQREENQKLSDRIELLEKQLLDKNQEINQIKTEKEITEREETEFKQEASERVNQIMAEAVKRVPWASKGMEQDLKELINKPLRTQFMNYVYGQHLANAYNTHANSQTEKESENLEAVIEEIIGTHWRSTDYYKEVVMKDWKLHRDESKIVPQIKKGGNIWGKPAKDIILKDIIESKVQRIKELEVKLEELEKELKSEKVISLCHLDALGTAEVWHETKVLDITQQKDADLAKAHQRIKELEDILIVKNNQNKNLKESKNWGVYKFKQLASKMHRVKEKSQEKFHAFIIQKSK